MDLIFTLISSSSLTGILYLFDSYRKQKKAFWFYLRYFLVMFVIFYAVKFFVNRAYSAESIQECCFQIEYNAELEKEFILSFLDSKKLMTDDQLANFQKKLDYHNAQYSKCYKQACELARWGLPTLTEEQNAAYCWAAAGTVIGGFVTGGSPIFVMLAVIYETSLQYVSDCSLQWKQMQTHLYEAKYHSEMAWFYADIIANEINKRRQRY